jgi:hypothetical protein
MQFRRHSRWHVRGYSPQRRVLLDTHDLRVGLFWVKGQSTWLHLPGIVIRLKGGG